MAELIPFRSDDGLIKQEAIYPALELVLQFNATLEITHASPFEGPL